MFSPSDSWIFFFDNRFDRFPGRWFLVSKCWGEGDDSREGRILILHESWTLNVYNFSSLLHTNFHNAWLIISTVRWYDFNEIVLFKILYVNMHVKFIFIPLIRGNFRKMKNEKFAIVFSSSIRNISRRRFSTKLLPRSPVPGSFRGGYLSLRALSGWWTGRERRQKRPPPRGMWKMMHNPNPPTHLHPGNVPKEAFLLVVFLVHEPKDVSRARLHYSKRLTGWQCS